MMSVLTIRDVNIIELIAELKRLCCRLQSMKAFMSSEVELTGIEVNGIFWDTCGLNLVKETSKPYIFSRIFKAMTSKCLKTTSLLVTHSQYLYSINFSFIATQYKFAVDTVALSNTEITITLK